MADALPTISVAMATYNGERFLRAQLRSLAVQTHLPHELVVCDDQSHDATVAIIEDFARTAPFAVRVERNPVRLHFGENFLQAASRCRGSCIAFCDQDDVWAPDKLAHAAAALARDDVVLFTHDATMIDEADAELGHHAPAIRPGGFAGWHLDPWLVFFGFTCVFRRSLLDLAPAGSRPSDLIEPSRRMSHDRWICFLASVSGTIVYDPQPLARYRQHAASVSGWMRQRRGARAILAALRHKHAFYIAKRLDIVSALCRLAEEIVDRPLPTLSLSVDDKAAVRRVWQAQVAHFRSREAIVVPTGRTRRIAAWWNAYRADAYRDPISGRTLHRELALDLAGAVLAPAARRPS